MKRTNMCAALFGLVAAAFGSAAAQTQVLDVEQALQHPELLTFSEVLRPRSGDVRMTTGPVEPGVVILSIPIAHRRTAIVEQDVGEGLGILVSPRVLVNGARGFWSGNFSPAANIRGEAAWCFLDERQERVRSLCFVPRINAKAPASYNRDSRYLAEQLAVTTEVDNQWDTPLVSEQPVLIHDDLRLDYVFDGWRGRDAIIEIHIGGDAFTTLRIPASSQGAATLPTAAGAFTMQRPEARGRGAIVAMAPAPATLRVERERMLSLPDLNARPIPVVRALAGVTPEAAPRTVAPGTELFAQDVVPGQTWALDQHPPFVDTRAAHALGPLSSFRINGHDLACALTPRIDPQDVTFRRLENGRRVSQAWEFCVEDADAVPGFDHWRWPGFHHGSNIGIWWVTTGVAPLDEPLTATLTDADWPPEIIRLYYVSGDDEARTPSGLRPRVAVFRVGIGDAERMQPDWWVLPVVLDEAGRGELRLGGRVVARIDGVELDGTARVQVLAGLPEMSAPLLEPSDFNR